ncbi:MAG: hypothetical protein KGL39_38940, partial [Patescibacteria group bacterium]|nr:hypothetical protein [Patescibacteria group bacterium]
VVLDKPFQTTDQEPVVPGHKPGEQGQGGVLANAFDQGINNASSGLSAVAGHQDILYILYNASLRDAAEGRKNSLFKLHDDPNSYVSKATKLWETNPTAAMDEYGAGSPRQNAFMKAHPGGGKIGSFEGWMSDHPVLNMLATAGLEFANPGPIAEGATVGGAMGGMFGGPVTAGVGALLGGAGGELLHGAAMAPRALNWLRMLIQAGARELRIDSPLQHIANRAGNKGLAWANALVNGVQAPEKFLHVDSTEKVIQDIYKDFTPDEQEEIFNLAAGEPLDPRFASKASELIDAANKARADFEKVTQLQLDHELLKPSEVRKDFVPMKNAYEYETPPTVEANRQGMGTGYGRTAKKPKTYNSPRDARAKGGKLAPDFLAANQHAAWRRSRLAQVAFEKIAKTAPESLHVGGKGTKGVRKALSLNPTEVQLPHWDKPQTAGELGGRSYQWYANPREVWSPAMRRGAWAPEVFDFVTKDRALQKFVEAGSSAIPGHARTFGQKFIAFARTMIIANPGWHPEVNISRNAAAARDLYNIPNSLAGVKASHYGYIIESARAAALQLHLAKPEWFMHGAEQYAHWLDRALAAGAAGEFGTPVKSALGGERARVLTVPPKDFKTWGDRLLTRLGSWNRSAVFGSRGEEYFSVSLFRDAVRGGYSEADAAAIVRQALHDYHSWDPTSPVSAVSLFMPWKKSNTKFWADVLMRKPNLITGVTHPIRNENLGMDPEGMRSPYPANDFRAQLERAGQLGLTYAFPAKDIEPWANIVAGKGDPLVNTRQALLSTANPAVRLLESAYNTAQDAVTDTKDVKGPENSWGMLYNPKAPGTVKLNQALRQVAGTLMPIPLVGFAMQDAIRRGWTPNDFTSALASTLNVGYIAGPRLNSSQRRALSNAKKQYLNAYYKYEYHDHNEKELEHAWTQYTNRLHDAKIVP